MTRFVRAPSLALSTLVSLACTDPSPDDGASTDDEVGTSEGDTETTGDSSETGTDTETSESETSSDSEQTDDTEESDGSTDTGGDPECGAPATFEDGQQPSAEIHVATDGADSPDCGAPDQPCASIEHAAGLATPGTAVRVHAGTYAGGGYIAGLTGSADAPIWIGGAPGEARPLIDGGGQAFQLSEARYVIVHDLEVANATQNGINVDDGGNTADPEAARFIVFRDLWIHDVGAGGNQDCLKLSGLDDYWVLDSEFARCGGGGSGSAIDHVGCHHGLIYANHFSDLGAGGSAVQNKGGAEDIEIRANVFDDAGQRAINMGGSTGFEFFRPPLSPDQPNAEARDIRVIANTFHGGVTPFAFVGCVDCLAANNVIDTPSNWIFRILQETSSTAEYEFLPASGGRFINNIVTFDGQVSTAVNVGGGTDPDSFEITTNLWYRHDAPAQSDPPGTLPVAEQGGIIGEDPLFVDPGAGDYHLDPNSPAVGAGTWIDALDGRGGGDLDEQCWADPPSLGALESL